MSVHLVLHDVIADADGLRLDGHVEGGSLQRGDHLATPGGGHHLHVRDVAAGEAGRAVVLVDAAGTTGLDAGVVLVRVAPVPAGSLLPMDGLPAGVDMADVDELESDAVRIPTGTETEPGGSGPGYDPSK